MSEEQKNPLLPKVDFPTMDMPSPPGIPGVDPDKAQHVSCEGELYVAQPSPDTIKPPPDGVPRILIGIPILSYSYEFVESFLKFWTQICTMRDVKFEACFYFAYRKPVHMAEQMIVDIARYNKCTHVLFMDDDIYDVSLEMLLKLLQADKDVIAGVMYASKFPHAMCCFRRFDAAKKLIDQPVDNTMYRLYEIPCNCTACGIGLSHWDAKFCLSCGAPQDNLIQKVDLIPFCFTLIKMSVFDKLKQPYFHCEVTYPTDSWFADRCAEAGIQEWAHMAVRLNHAGCNDQTRPQMFQMGLDKARSTQAVVNLTPTDMQKHEFMLHNKMQEAEQKLKTRLSIIQPETTLTAQEEQNDSQEKSITDGVPEEAGTTVSG